MPNAGRHTTSRSRVDAEELSGTMLLMLLLLLLVVVQALRARLKLLRLRLLRLRLRRGHGDRDGGSTRGLIGQHHLFERVVQTAARCERRRRKRMLLLELRGGLSGSPL